MKTHASPRIFFTSLLLAGSATFAFAQATGTSPTPATQNPAAGAPATDSPAVAAPAAPAAPAPAANDASTRAAADVATDTAAAPQVKPAPALPQARILPMVDRTTAAGATLTGSLEGGRVASTIQTQEFENRDALVAELTERVNAAERHLNEMRQRATNLDDDARKAIDAATKSHEQNRSRLQESIERARTSDRENWERARSALATDYAFYVSTVGSMEVAIPN